MGTNEKFKAAGYREAIDQWKADSVRPTQPNLLKNSKSSASKAGGCGSFFAVLALSVTLIGSAAYYLF